MTATQTNPTQTGITVSTAGGITFNHAEGVVVSTAIVGGGPGVVLQHAEGIVASTVIRGGAKLNHAEGVVVSTAIVGGGPGLVVQHAEGIVVSTAIAAGGIGIVLQHAEGIVVSTPIAAGGRSLNHAEGTVVTTHAARRGRRSAIMAIAAGALLLTPITALAQVPVRPPPPPAPTPPPPQAEPPAPPAPPPVALPANPIAPEPALDPPATAPQLPSSAGEQPPKLTQIYRGDDGSALYLRAEGTTVVGFAEHPVKKYAFVFRGTRTKNVISGNWYDVAKGTRQTFAGIQLKVFKKGDRLVRSGGTDFGPDVFNVISASKIAWPGGREAGFQALSPSDLDGAFIGKSAALEPDGSRLYWKEHLTLGPIGVAEGPRASGTTRPRWVSVFFGQRDAQGKIAGEYFDVPKGTGPSAAASACRPLSRSTVGAMCCSSSMPRT